jgi:hypothetical protein
MTPIRWTPCANVNAHSFLNTTGLALTSAQFTWTLAPYPLTARSIAVFQRIATPAGFPAANRRAYAAIRLPGMFNRLKSLLTLAL